MCLNLNIKCKRFSKSMRKQFVKLDAKFTLVY